MSEFDPREAPATGPPAGTPRKETGPAATEPRTVSASLLRPFILLATPALVIAGLYWLQAVLIPIALAMLLTFLLSPAALPGLLQAVEDGADLAVGSRYIPGGSISRWSVCRRALSRWGNRYASWALALPLADATSGFRAYRADTVARLDLRSVRADGYGFQIEMAYRVASEGGCIVELPIEFADRERGTSKMSSRIVVEALLLVTWWGLRDRPRRRRSARLPVRARSRTGAMPTTP